jgi:hypothetical protein
MVMCGILNGLFFRQSGIIIQGGFFCPSWKILGDWCRERDSLSAFGVSEGELPGMKEVSLMRSSASINWIARHRLPKVFEVHSDLVGAPGSWTAFDQSLGLIGGEDTVVGESFTAPLINGHFLAVDLVATDSGVDFAMGHAWSAVDKCEISFFDTARSEFVGD